MRTCPACGDDTDAGYAEACTNCGFSPGEPQHPQQTFEVGDEATIPSSLEPSPAPGESGPSPQQTGKRKRRGPGVGTLIWLVIIGGSLAADGLGIFEEPTGPSADQVEAAMLADAAELGAKITVDCPDDADETDIGAGFECTLTTRRGRTATIEVRNREDTYEYERGELVALVRGRG